MDKDLEYKIAARYCHLLWAQGGISCPGGPRALPTRHWQVGPVGFPSSPVYLVRCRRAGEERGRSIYLAWLLEACQGQSE
jgi:hypothetical protein